MPKKTKKISAEKKDVVRLSEAVEKSVSPWRTILLGILRGLSAAIGATIIAAVVIAIIWKMKHPSNNFQ